MYGTQGQPNFYPPHHAGGPGFGSPFPGAQNKPVGVYWDIENCPVPKDVLASSVVHFIRSSFILNRLNHREFEFLVAADVLRLRKDISTDLDKTGGVVLAHVSGDSKNAADEKIRESMKRFVDTHATFSPMLILISGDIDFLNDLRGYQTRLGCTIVVLHGATASPHFKAGWNEVYAFKEFLLRMPPPATNAVGGGSGNQPAIKNKANGGAVAENKVQGSGTGNMNPGTRQPNPQQQSADFRPRNPGQQNADFRPRNPGQQNADFRPRNPGQQNNDFRPRNPGPRGPNPQQNQQQGNFNPRNAARFPAQGAAGFNATTGGQQNQYQQNQQNQQQNQFQQNQQQQNVPGNSGAEPKLSNRAKKRSQKHGSNQNLAGPLAASNAPSPQPEGQNNQPRRNKNNAIPHGANGGPAGQRHPSGQSEDGGQNQNFGGVVVKKEKKEKKRKNSNASQESNNPGSASGNQAKNDAKGPKPNIILMVSGLPGKMDFRILKDHLQEYASQVSGKVMYVHNGQAFITFRKQEDADRAISLFQGKEVYGKQLNIQLSKTIPFQNPKPGTGGTPSGQGQGAGAASGSGPGADNGQNAAAGFVMVDPPPQRPPPPSNAGTGNAGNSSPGFLSSSSSNSNFQAFVGFATAAMNELALNQAGQQEGAAGGQKKKKEKVKADPNCVVQ